MHCHDKGGSVGLGGAYGVEHEAVDSLAGGENHHGGTAVESVARRHNVSSRLQGVFLTRLSVCGLCA